MLYLIPAPKKVVEENQYLSKKHINYSREHLDYRLLKQLDKFPFAKDGIEIKFSINDQKGEGYKLSISDKEIKIVADSNAGAFYAIQTLRQIFRHEKVPFCTIEDEPDFEYRGFYHDVTRGKVPTVETIKKLIDDMAYVKLNSLQLYVEHVFEFPEYADSIEKTGYFTAEEIKEIDRYCIDNFIDFIPSLSCFGHLYELLQKDKYKHLCMLENYEPKEHMWPNRMAHHTIDPTNPESFELIKGMIDRYGELFTSKKFNICCDETFDLSKGKLEGKDTVGLFVDFSSKLINYLHSKGKTAMMWCDMIINHLDRIDEIPSDVEILNYNYGAKSKEEQISDFARCGSIQIVCPGTSSWSRFVENTDIGPQNISWMAECGKKYNAKGLLNTNWGDWGNPCSIELAKYSLGVGAQKSWSAYADIDEYFDDCMDMQTYQNKGTSAYVKKLSAIHQGIDWNDFIRCYSDLLYENKFNVQMPSAESLEETAIKAEAFIEELAGAKWQNDDYRQELILSAKALCVIAYLWSKMAGSPIKQRIDTKVWLLEYREKWLSKNKESELCEIEKVFNYLENM